MPVLFSCRRASWLRSRVQTRGEEEQVNVEGRSGGRVDKGKTGNRGRLLLVHFVSTACKCHIWHLECVPLCVVDSVWVIFLGLMGGGGGII